MTVNTAVEQLLEVEAARGGGAYGPDTLAVGISRLGAPDQQIVAGPMRDLVNVDFGPPLHCLVIAGAVHVVEEEMLAHYRAGGAGAAAVAADAREAEAAALREALESGGGGGGEGAADGGPPAGGGGGGSSSSEPVTTR
jgi:hypothetical protein